MPIARGTMLLVAAGSLLALVGCQSPLESCQKAHPGDAAAAQACFQAVLQQQNRQLNQLHSMEYRGRE